MLCFNNNFHINSELEMFNFTNVQSGQNKVSTLEGNFSNKFLSSFVEPWIRSALFLLWDAPRILVLRDIIEGGGGISNLCLAYTVTCGGQSTCRWIWSGCCFLFSKHFYWLPRGERIAWSELDWNRIENLDWKCVSCRRFLHLRYYTPLDMEWVLFFHLEIFSSQCERSVLISVRPKQTTRYSRVSESFQTVCLVLEQLNLFFTSHVEECILIVG